MTKCVKCGEAFEAPCDRTICLDCWRKENPWDSSNAFSPTPSGYVGEYNGFEAGRPLPRIVRVVEPKVLGAPACSANHTVTNKAGEEIPKRKHKKFVEEDKAQKALEAF